MDDPANSRPDRPERGSFVSAGDVAERAGVSRSAVSRTFSGAGSVSAATRRKVMKAAEELGYHANHLARGLTGEPSDIVCLIAADIGQPFQARMLEQVTRHLQLRGKVAMVINTAGDGDSVSHALRQSLHYRAEASVVLTGTPSEKLVQTCLSNGQRVVLVNRDDEAPGVDRLRVDNDRACVEALALLRRAGCERVACVSSRARTTSLLSREAAFSRAAEAAGLTLDLTRAGPTSYETGAESARLLLGRAAPPDGVFCVTDLLALGFMDAARHVFGRRIPEDLCVIGFDDVPQASWTSYELTTFRQPIEEFAERIAAVLTSDEVGHSEVLEVLPVWRSSVRMA
ncbi:LacI family DNA-binding transcriptional regulator [Wenxinia marina]|uniref:Transcriptional regulator, LacI family n=1 Tax=Wenxinia marina DSM 24838 TaxID=1123501 RepID=A0A0D0NPR4_9RHOB|nr:LacI family DNA-binding transcriptional regulator [Wenxinia marina]KIQ70245.1 transcriptional regulator, LacI family [Wenxinia marina DSM 24838]